MAVEAVPPCSLRCPIPRATYQLAAQAWAAAGLVTPSADGQQVILHPTIKDPEYNHADHHIPPNTEGQEDDQWHNLLTVDTPTTATPILIYESFGGTGFLRMAVNELLAKMGAQASLIASGFSESNPRYGYAVEQYWASGDKPEWGPAHQWLSRDVWGMLDVDATGTIPLQRVLTQAPDGALFLIGGGFPCKQMSGLSYWGGRIGLHGDDSVHFFAMTILRRVIAELRPDLVIHLLVENVDTMRPMFKDAISRAMGDLPAQNIVCHTNAA